jgi:hypothetical protein
VNPPQKSRRLTSRQADILMLVAALVLPLGWVLPLCRLAWAQAQARGRVRQP